MSTIVFVGQFPPPTNGLTVITSRLAAALAKAGYDVKVVSTTGPLGRRSVRFHLMRINRLMVALCSIASIASSRKSRICYLTAEGGLGLIYSVVISIWARLLRFRIYIHHHSFSYIIERRSLMKLLLVWSGPEAVHICLSSDMAQDLANCYARDLQSIILSNAAFVDQVTTKPVSKGRNDLTIGLLSNLTAGKGLHEFAGILRQAKHGAIPIRGILAGPPASQTDKAFVESLQGELGESLDYRGPVYDEEKSRFFHDIDVFVFLTTYLNEAQPTVLYEAMAHGITVITNDRGCIRSQVARGGHVFTKGAETVPETLRLLEHYRQKPNSLIDQKLAALSHFEDERLCGRKRLANLFEARPTKVLARACNSQ